MAWYTYIVRCADDSLYCGITTDLERRINEHNSTRKDVFYKGSFYCRSRQPVKLVWSREYPDRSGASKCEHRIKKLPRVKKEELIASTATKQNSTLSEHLPSSAERR